MKISERIYFFKRELPVKVKLVAVSKNHTAESVMEAYNAGQRVFGENKVQEMVAKYPLLPKDIEWHAIGHLQTNKVKYIAPFVSMIQSVDSLKLLHEINIQAEKNNRVIDCLLEFHIASEDSKYGLSFVDAEAILKSPDFKNMQHIRICGVMGMASFSDDNDLVRNEFKSLKKYFNQLKEKYFSTSDYFKEISMGMTGDYPIAIEEGATIVRIGTAIFGERNYL